MVATGGWGPDGRAAAVSVTFDNLGEAREVGAGLWPTSRAVGQHESVTRALPRLLSLLDELSLRASFFAEGWNVDVYPDALRQIEAAGHDLGLHGWVHEPWSRLSEEEAVELIERGIDRARAAQVRFTGFRPPGGVLGQTSLATLVGHGMDWVSPLSDTASVSEGVAVVPFQWEVVDAYHEMDELADFRSGRGDRASSATPAEGAALIRQAVERTVRRGGYTAITLHPILLAEDEAFDAARQLIAAVSRDADLWCAPCSEVSAWMKAAGDRFAEAPQLDGPTWL